MKYNYHLGVWDEDSVFVFGSNEAGRHGKGAALFAKNFCGAKTGCGAGITGNSYAIPTKDRNLGVLPLCAIKRYIEEFKKYAEIHKECKFFVTAIGTGLAGYNHEEIAPLFVGVSGNCILPRVWKKFVEEKQ